MTLHRTLPVSGEIVGRTTATGLVDKGAGRGALLYSDKQVISKKMAAPEDAAKFREETSCKHDSEAAVLRCTICLRRS